MTDTGPAWVSRGESFRGASNNGVPTLTTDSTLTNVSPAPAAGYKIHIDDIIVRADAACSVTIAEESGGVLCPPIEFSGRGIVQITPRNGLRTQTAGKRVTSQASGTVNVSVLINGHYVT